VFEALEQHGASAPVPEELREPDSDRRFGPQRANLVYDWLRGWDLPALVAGVKDYCTQHGLPTDWLFETPTIEGR
jgi:hypothetical protein